MNNKKARCPKCKKTFFIYSTSHEKESCPFCHYVEKNPYYIKPKEDAGKFIKVG